MSRMSDMDILRQEAGLPSSTSLEALIGQARRIHTAETAAGKSVESSEALDWATAVLNGLQGPHW